MKLVRLYLIPLALCFLSGCSLTDEDSDIVVGNGIRLSSTRTVSSSIKKVSLENSYDVQIRTGRDPRIEVKADQNLLEHVGITSPARDQVVFSNSKELLPTSDILVDLHLPSLEGASLRFDSEARALAVSEPFMELVLREGARMELSGFVEQLKVTMSETATLEAAGLVVSEMNLHAVQTASASIGEVSTLTVVLQDSARLSVSSSPSIASSDIAPNATYSWR